MQQNSIDTYVAEQLKAGYSESDIKNALLTGGWPADAVDSILVAAQGHGTTLSDDSLVVPAEVTSINLTEHSDNKPEVVKDIESSSNYGEVTPVSSNKADQPAGLKDQLGELYGDLQDNPIIHTGLIWALKIGFAAVLIISGIITLITPGEFIAVAEAVPVLAAAGSVIAMLVGLITIALGVLLLSGEWHKPVLISASIWLAVITFIKIVALI